jgi:ubiquinone biosynthesis protein
MEKRKPAGVLKRLKRLNEIIFCMRKYNLTTYFIGLPFSKTPMKKVKPNKQPVEVRIRLLFEELGPTFVKMAQVMSTQYDIMPREFCEEFQKLQDQVPQFSSEKVKEIIEAELQAPVSELFDDFEETPVASASLSQVHKARLKSGEVVAVKVQRPDIEEKINLDFDLLLYLGKFVNRSAKIPKSVDVIGLINEVKDAILKELDFTTELNNITTIYNNLKGDDAVKTPKAYSDFTTSKVLVMEFIDGTKITDLKTIEEKGLDKNEIMTNLIRNLYKQILRDGFYHGDPHPANVFVTDEGKLAFLDFGAVGIMDAQNKQSYIDQSKTLAAGDSLGFIKVYTDNNGFDMSTLDLETLEYEIDKKVLSYFKQEIKSNGEFYFKVIMLMFQHGVSTPHQIAVLSRCLLSLSALIRIYDFSNEDTARIIIESIKEDVLSREGLPDLGIMDGISEIYSAGMGMVSKSVSLFTDVISGVHSALTAPGPETETHSEIVPETKEEPKPATEPVQETVPEPAAVKPVPETVISPALEAANVKPDQGAIKGPAIEVAAPLISAETTKPMTLEPIPSGPISEFLQNSHTSLKKTKKVRSWSRFFKNPSKN